MTEQEHPEKFTEDPADAETAFIVYRSFDGAWHATPDLGTNLVVERLSGRNDMKQAFRDLLDAIAQNDIADLIVQKLGPKSSEDSQRRAASIRQSLASRENLQN